MRETTVPHVAVVTGANAGIGAATAVALGRRGVSVLIAFFRPGDAEGQEEAYNRARRGDGTDVVAAVQAAGGRAHAVEADLTDPAAPAQLFDLAEKHLGPVDILVNNASGWVQDTFTPATADRFGRPMAQVTERTFRQQFGVTANIVYPPVTDTGWVTDEVRASVAASRELTHVATPDEVAEVIG